MRPICRNSSYIINCIQIIQISIINRIVSVNYGYLYNLYAVDDVRGISANGSHVITRTEFQSLVDYVGGDAVAGAKLKEAGTTYWDLAGGTNDYLFNARGS